MYIKLSTFIFTGLLLTWSLFTSSLTFAEEGIEYQFVLAWGEQGSDIGQFASPSGLAIAPDGSVYVADSFNHRIQQFSSQGDFIRTWGSEGSDVGQLSFPSAIAIASDGNIYVADRNNHRIQQFNTQGDFIRTWGSQASGNDHLGIIRDIAIAPDNSIYSVDSLLHRIQQFSAQGDFIRTWGSRGTKTGQFESPESIAIAPDGSVYVADRGNHRIQQFNAQGDFIRTWGSEGSDDGEFIAPNNIAIGSDGSVYVAGSNPTILSGSGTIQQFSAHGDFIRSWGEVGSDDGQTVNIQGMALAPDGSFYVSDIGNRIQKFEPKNKTSTTLSFSSQGSFAEPSDIPEQAVPILVNDEPQYHLLDDKGDQDWFEFYAEQGTRYTIKLPQASIGSAIDPIVTLFDEAGNELESVNNSPLGQEEQLDWTATDTALFRIRVTNAPLKTKVKPTALEYAYTINVFLSDAPQQGIIKGSVLDSCQELGLGKVVVTAALGGQLTESTFTHKTGEYGIPINPGDYDLNTQIENYQNSQKNVSVAQVTASQVQFSLDPVTDCSQTAIRVADPTILLQQAVANYNDQTGLLIIKDVLADGRTYYAELQDQGGYNFSLTDAIELPGSVHSGPADYSFETLLVNIPAVFAFNTLYKVQMKNDGDFFFSLVEASAP